MKHMTHNEKHTSAQAGECCLGDKKNVPSTSGYLSKTSMAARQRTHVTRDHCRAANVDRIKHLVSSLPWLPSSSIWKQTANKHIITLRAQSCCINIHIIIKYKSGKKIACAYNNSRIYLSSRSSGEKKILKKEEWMFLSKYKFKLEDLTGNIHYVRITSGRKLEANLSGNASR